MAATNAVFPLDLGPRQSKGDSKEAGKALFDPGEFYFEQARYMCSEKDGLAEIKVMRKDGMTSISEKQVQVATEDGTALAGKNYQPTRTMITFPPGVETQSFRVALFNSPSYDPCVTFTVKLSTTKNVVYGTAEVDIMDDVSKFSLLCRQLNEGTPYIVVTVFAMVFTIIVPQIQTLYVPKSSDEAFSHIYTLCVAIFAFDQFLQCFTRKWLYIGGSGQIMDLVAIIGTLLLCKWFYMLFFPERMDPTVHYYRHVALADWGHIMRVMKLGVLIGRFSGILIYVVNWIGAKVKKLQSHLAKGEVPSEDAAAEGARASRLTLDEEEGGGTALEAARASADGKSGSSASTFARSYTTSRLDPSECADVDEAAAAAAAKRVEDEAKRVEEEAKIEEAMLEEQQGQGNNKMIVSVVEGLVSRLVLVVTVVLFLYLLLSAPSNNRLKSQGLLMLTLTYYWEPTSANVKFEESSSYIGLKTLFAMPTDTFIGAVDPKIDYGAMQLWLEANNETDDLGLEATQLVYLDVGGRLQAGYEDITYLNDLRDNGEMIFAGFNLLNDEKNSYVCEFRNVMTKDDDEEYTPAFIETTLSKMTYGHFDDAAKITLNSTESPACPVLQECEVDTREGYVWSIKNACGVSSAVFDNRPELKKQARARLWMAGGMVVSVLLGVIMITVDLLHKVLNPLLRLAVAAKKMKSHMDLLTSTISIVAGGPEEDDPPPPPPLSRRSSDAAGQLRGNSMKTIAAAPAGLGDGKLDESEATQLVRAMMGKGEEGDTLFERVEGLRGLWQEVCMEPINLMVQALYDVENTLGISVDGMTRAVLAFQSEVDARWPVLKAIASRVDDKTLTREFLVEGTSLLVPSAPPALTETVDKNPKLRALKAVGTMGSLAAKAAVAGPMHSAEAALAADLGLEAGKELTIADYEEWVLRKMRPVIRASVAMTGGAVNPALDEMDFDQLKDELSVVGKEGLRKYLTPLGVNTEQITARRPALILKQLETAVVRALVKAVSKAGAPVPSACRSAENLQHLKALLEASACGKFAEMVTEHLKLKLPPASKITDIKWGFVAGVLEKIAEKAVAEQNKAPAGGEVGGEGGQLSARDAAAGAAGFLAPVLAAMGRVVSETKDVGTGVLSHPAVQISIIDSLEGALVKAAGGGGAAALQAVAARARDLKIRLVDLTRGQGARGVGAAEVRQLLDDATAALKGAAGGEGAARALEMLQAVIKAFNEAAREVMSRVDPEALKGKLSGLHGGISNFTGAGAAALMRLAAALEERAGKGGESMGDVLSGEKAREAIMGVLDASVAMVPPEKREAAREAISHVAARLSPAEMAAAGPVAVGELLELLDRVRVSAGGHMGGLGNHMNKMIQALGASGKPSEAGSVLTPAVLFEKLRGVLPSDGGGAMESAKEVLDKAQDLLRRFPMPQALGGYKSTTGGVPTTIQDAIKTLATLAKQGGAELAPGGERAAEIMLQLLQPLDKVKDMAIEAARSQGLSFTGAPGGQDIATVIMGKVNGVVAKLRELVAQMLEELLASNGGALHMPLWAGNMRSDAAVVHPMPAVQEGSGSVQIPGQILTSRGEERTREEDS